MEAIKILRDIKRGKDITPYMVNKFIESLGIKAILNKPLPIVLGSKTITDKKIVYSEEHIYDMLYLFYGYIPKTIKRKELFNIITRIIISPPTDFMDRIFNGEIQIDINTFIKRFMKELN
ncbi:hypothetical protein ChPV270 [Cheloniid poxvirus 1]|nr:hypothetical protein ChPV270 [Cheloniid poxvirus 1]